MIDILKYIKKKNTILKKDLMDDRSATSWVQENDTNESKDRRSIPSLGIGRDDKLSSGIIYIRTEDPISRLILSLSQNEYSAVGFYCPSTSTGKLEILVVLVDIFQMKIPFWIPPSGSRYTLDQVLTNPLVSRISIRKLQPILGKDNQVDIEATRRLQMNFRATIANVMNNLSEIPLAEALSDLFSRKNKLKKSFAMIDQVCALLLSNGTSRHTVHDSNDKINNHENLFGPMLEIPLDKNTDLIRRNALSAYKSSLISFMEQIVDHMITQPKLYDQFLNIFSSELLLSICQGCSDIMSLISQALIKGDLRLDQLKRVMNSNNNLFVKISETFGVQFEPVDIPTLNQDRLMNICTPESPIISNSDYSQSANKLYEMVSNMINTLDTGNTVKIDLNNLITLVNQLNPKKQIPLLKGELSYPGILIVSSLGSEFADTPVIIHQNDHEIVLPSKGNPDLSKFTVEELKEIAVNLDAMEDTNRFISLRSAIARRLAQLRANS